MKYLRVTTYLMLLGAVYLAMHPRRWVVPTILEPPPYALQAEQLLARTDLSKMFGAAGLEVSGGLPADASWQYNEGPDFDVWTAVNGKGRDGAVVGVYAGRNPRVNPPAADLEAGTVGGIPVLWWRHRTTDYRTVWDALIPHPRVGYLHVWIASYAPQRVAAAAELLKTVRFTAVAQSEEKPNQASATPAPVAPAVGAAHL